MPGPIAWHSASVTGMTYDARCQVTENPLPPLFSGPGAALTAPEESTIVISSSVKEEITPEVLPSVTVEPASAQGLKCASGKTPLVPLGASAIHSALVFAQLPQLCVVVKLLAGWVESVTDNV